MNPRAYIKNYDEKVKAAQKKLSVNVESEGVKSTKSGRKSKKQKETEDRMKDQAAFLLFLKKEEAENKTEHSS